jgi:hypothetical protein
MLTAVHEGHIELSFGRGDPGYHLAGIIQGDGTVKLLGEGVSNLPGFSGKHYAIILDGEFKGETLRAHGRHGERTCDLVLNRLPG